MKYLEHGNFSKTASDKIRSNCRILGRGNNMKSNICIYFREQRRI